MTKFVVEYAVRRLGALGKPYSVKLTVHAEDRDGALDKAREHFYSKGLDCVRPIAVTAVPVKPVVEEDLYPARWDGNLNDLRASGN